MQAQQSDLCSNTMIVFSGFKYYVVPLLAEEGVLQGLIQQVINSLDQVDSRVAGLYHSLSCSAEMLCVCKGCLLPGTFSSPCPSRFGLGYAEVRSTELLILDWCSKWTYTSVFKSCSVDWQAEVGGQKITWLTPHVLSQVLPPDVDFRVMLTFVEFYEVFWLWLPVTSFTI